MTGACLRSMSCASADEVWRSIACGDNRHRLGELRHRQPDVGRERATGSLDGDGLFLISLEGDLDRVLAGRHLQDIAAIDVRIGNFFRLHHLDRHARQRNRVGLIPDDPDHTSRTLSRRLRLGPHRRGDAQRERADEQHFPGLASKTHKLLGD